MAKAARLPFKSRKKDGVGWHGGRGGRALVKVGSMSVEREGMGGDRTWEVGCK